MNELVSVIIPCYNTEKYVADTIRSVLAQTYPSIEIIVVDDGSKDSSPEVIRSFAGDGRIKILSQPNSGVSAARNNGLKNAKGVYVAFLDADDWMYPTNIEEKVKILQQFTADVAYSTVEVSDEKLSPLHLACGANPNRFAEEVFNFVPSPIHSPSSAVIRRSAVEESGGFDIDLSTSADLDIWIRLSFKYKFARIEKPLVKYRLVPGSMNTNVDNQIRDMEHIFQKYKHHQQADRKIGRLKRAFYYSIVGNAYHKKNVFRLLKYAIKYFKAG
ncbi:MAG: glycosyltransferase [Chitinophagaceae bacterium]|nr:glycosyltransferase [Chitinophagaceae bacterium]